MTKAKRIVAYRNRAEQLRILAEASLYEYEAQILRAIAATYDRLADDVAAEPSIPAAKLVVPRGDWVVPVPPSWRPSV